MYLFLPAALTPILALITCTQRNTTPYVVVSGVELISDTFTVLCIKHDPIYMDILLCFNFVVCVCVCVCVFVCACVLVCVCYRVWPRWGTGYCRRNMFMHIYINVSSVCQPNAIWHRDHSTHYAVAQSSRPLGKRPLRLWFLYTIKKYSLPQSRY